MDSCDDGQFCTGDYRADTLHHCFLIIAAISMIRISEQNLGQENSILMTHSISV